MPPPAMRTVMTTPMSAVMAWRNAAGQPADGSAPAEPRTDRWAIPAIPLRSVCNSQAENHGEAHEQTAVEGILQPAHLAAAGRLLADRQGQQGYDGLYRGPGRKRRVRQAGRRR